MNIRPLRPDAQLYNEDIGRWWIPAHQRIVVLTFPSIIEAMAWDEHPDLDHLIGLDHERKLHVVD